LTTCVRKPNFASAKNLSLSRFGSFVLRSRQSASSTTMDSQTSDIGFGINSTPSRAKERRKRKESFATPLPRSPRFIISAPILCRMGDLQDSKTGISTPSSLLAGREWTNSPSGSPTGKRQTEGQEEDGHGQDQVEGADAGPKKKQRLPR